MVHIYNGILLSHEKEHIWVSSSEVDEPRACYAEWSKSEREKQVLYINAYIWNLEKWYWWIYLQGSNRDTSIENRLVGTTGKGEGGMNWESSTETYTSPYAQQMTSGNFLWDTGSSSQCPTTTWRGGVEWEVGGRRHMYCIPMVDSCGCMAETNTTLLSNYPLIKNKEIKKN